MLPQRLLDALGSIFHLEFVATSEIDETRGGAALLFGTSREEAEGVARRGIRSMVFLHESLPIDSEKREIQFSRSSYLSECLRGRKLSDKSLSQSTLLTTKENDEVVASRNGEPFWLLSRNDSLGTLDLVATQPVELAEGDFLYKYLEQDNWARLLPLLHFLREVSGWQPPPIRACFMFDDPNLHWSSYGYIRYAELARHAIDHNYHAAFAMIPIDCWYVHQETAKLFRENSNRLSLLFHGNNHTYYELMQGATSESRESLAAQAIRRVERFERASGLTVPRAMAAPHGACSVAMGNALLRSGFEVACISRSSLMKRNPEVAWPPTVGMNPAEFLGEGLPVIPRFNIRWDSSYALFAAFLGQPIILVGHHDDLAGGLDLLGHWATFINAMGPVNWCNTATMARSNYRARKAGDVLEVEMFSRKIEMVVPEGCRQIDVRNQGSFAVKPGEKFALAPDYPNTIDVSRVATTRPGLWAIARRQLCEIRDRVRPLIARVDRVKQSAADAAPFSQTI